MCVCVCVPQGFYKGGKFVFSFKVRDAFTQLKNQFSITKEPLLMVYECSDSLDCSLTDCLCLCAHVRAAGRAGLSPRPPQGKV